jgi:hypothetical protein
MTKTVYLIFGIYLGFDAWNLVLIFKSFYLKVEP